MVDSTVFSVNPWAVLVSGVVYFMLGALWYGLLADPWMRGIGKSREELNSRQTDYLVSLVAEVAIAYGVGIGLNLFSASGVAEGIFVAALLWFFFSLLPTIIHYAYEDRSFGLLAINKGYDLLGILVSGVILALWR